MNNKLKKSLSNEHIRKIRKAAYWQKEYDEWKKYGAIYPSLNISEIINNNLLEEYINNGWENITEIYKQKMSVNNKLDFNFNNNNLKLKIHFEDICKEKQELTLNILSSIRKYMVNTIFNCIKKDINNKTINMNEIISVGSENTTSDFDISLLGPDANEIMWRMFITFLAKYQNSISDAFDTNLYSSPSYIHHTKILHEKIVCKSRFKIPQRVDYNNRFFILLPLTIEDVNTELNWSCVKLLDLNINIPEKLKKNFEISKKYKLYMDFLNKQVENDNVYLDISLQNNLHPANSISDETRKIIKKYYLQYKWQKSISNFIYSNDTSNLSFIHKKIRLKNNNSYEKNLFFYSNIPNYFSSEAYYTSSTFYSVVIKQQMNINIDIKRPLKIKNYIYIISAIENLGDMIYHIKKDSKKYNINKNTNIINSIKIILIKYSKYLIRIYTCLNLINDKYNNIINNINKYVLPFRNNYDIENANNLDIFKYIFYNNEISINNYVNKIGNKIILEINNIMNFI